MARTVTGLFDDLEAARGAVKALARAGIRTSDIELEDVRLVAITTSEQCVLTVHLVNDEDESRANDVMRANGGVPARASVRSGRGHASTKQRTKR
jgi:hypothetical protein